MEKVRDRVDEIVNEIFDNPDVLDPDLSLEVVATDIVDVCDYADNMVLIGAGALSIETGPASVVYAVYNLYRAVASLIETIEYYKELNEKFDNILKETESCIADAKSSITQLDTNKNKLLEAQELVGKNNEALNNLNSTIYTRFEKTFDHFKQVDRQVQNIRDKLSSSTEQILDNIESAKKRIINQMHDSRTERILAELSSFLEFVTFEAKQIQSLPLHMRIAKIKKDNGFIDLLIDTSKADKSMLSSLTQIIDFGIAIPKDTNDKLSLSMLELLCHGADVYLFIVTFLVQHYGILAIDYFYNSDMDNYNDYLIKCENVYNSFWVILFADDDALLPKITNKVLNNIKDSDFFSGNEELMKFVDHNLNKIEQINKFFIEMKSHSDDKEIPVVKDIHFDSIKIHTPILDWKKDAKVYYASQHWGNKSAPASKVSKWSTDLTLDKLANPHLKLNPKDHNSNKTRVILRKFEHGDPQIVALITNHTQSVFYDVDRDLYNAAHEPNVDMAWKNAQVYLNNGANVSAMFEHGKRAIHVATENNNWKVAQALIKNGANINEVDENGFTPIYIAAEAGYEQFVDELIKLKADVNVATGKNNHHFTPLHSAAFRKHPNIVKKLLQVSSIDITARTSQGLTSLNLAALNNDDEIIEIYFEKNINEIVDIQSVSEFPPIYFAYKNNNAAVANKLIDHCANVNIRLYDDKTLLHLAVIYSDLNVIRQLIDNFDVSVQDAQGRTPLHYAVMYGNEELTKFFISRGADPNALDSNGTPVIIYIVHSSEDKALAVIKELANSNKLLNINIPNKDTGNTILHIACFMGYFSVVQFLLEKGATVNSKNNKNETPLHLAAKIGHYFIVKSLIESNATFTTVSDTNETAVEYAVKGEGDLVMFQYFVEVVYKESIREHATGIVMANCCYMAAQNFKNDVINYYFKEIFSIPNHDDGLEIMVKSVTECLKSGNLSDRIKTLLPGVQDHFFEYIDHAGWTVLYYAIMGKGDFEMIKFIMQYSQFKLTVDDKKYGKTLLHLAIETKKVNVAKLLLEKKADFDNEDFEGDTQLHYAAKYGLNKIAELLTRKLDKSSINKKNKQNKTPLFVGVEGKANLNLIQGLINEGANLDGDEKQSLLDAAIVANKTDVARKFKDQPINKTNLHVAASNSNIELVDLLVDYKKIDINLEDSQNRKPIYSAVEGNGTLAMIQHLASKNADFINYDATTCENLITLAIDKKKFDIAVYLIETKGVDINTAGMSNISPLYQAVYVDNALFVAFLLGKGADYNFKMPNGTIPIDLIVDNKSNTIKYFTMMYRNDQNQTMLHLMAELDKVKVVQKLLERGAYVNAQDNDGNSPLHLAAKNGCVETVKMLCETKQKCINVELKNADKQTALDLAKSNKKSKVVDFLEHWHPKQRARRQVVEQFSEPPVSSSAGRPSWWVSDLVGSVVGTLGSITNEACQSVLSPSYYESRTASPQSISSLSASVNVHSTLLLLDVLARKFTGQSYVGTDSQSGSPLDARSNSLVIVQQFKRMLSRLASETNSQLVPELNSFELYRSVEHCLMNCQFNKIDQILLSFVRDAFLSDSVEDSLLVMSVEELLNEVLLGKKDSSLVETSSM